MPVAARYQTDFRVRVLLENVGFAWAKSADPVDGDKASCSRHLHMPGAAGPYDSEPPR